MCFLHLALANMRIKTQIIVPILQCGFLFNKNRVFLCSISMSCRWFLFFFWVGDGGTVLSAPNTKYLVFSD